MIKDKGYKDYSISIIRGIAFCLIFICHLLQFDNSELAFWFNVGVQIFLCISGYLHGARQIENDINYFVKKCIRVLVPYYLVIIPIILIHVVFMPEYITIKTIVKVLLCDRGIKGGEHLWFIATILMCYLLLPGILKFYEKISKYAPVKWVLANLFITFTVFITFERFLVFYKSAWINCFFIGVFLRKNELLKKIKVKYVNIFWVITAILCNSVQIYVDYVLQLDLKNKTAYIWYCNYSHVLLGVAIFVILKAIFDSYIRGQKIIKKAGEYIDRVTYECYLVHQFLILGPLSLMELFDNKLLNVAVIIVLTAVMGYSVHVVSTKIFEWTKTFYQNHRA